MAKRRKLSEEEVEALRAALAEQSRVTREHDIEKALSDVRKREREASADRQRRG